MNKTIVNPYIAGNPIRDANNLWGRSDVAKWVVQELHNPTTNALVLSGQRRVGKTSLLIYLTKTLPNDGFLPVYFDLMNQATNTLGKVLADLADTVSEKAGLPSPDSAKFDNEGRYFQKEFLPQLYKSLDPSVRPVFLLDEFDVLDQTAEAGLDSLAAAKSLFPFIRKLMIDDPRPAFIFVVGRRTDDLAIDFSSVFKTSLQKEIWVLDRPSAEQLIRQAESNETLKYTDEAVARIFELTNGHPYLTQLLCQRIWQQAYRNKPAKIPIIDVAEVNDAVSETLEVGEPALSWLWNGLGPAEKIYASALAEISDEDKPMPEERIIQVITANANRLRTREVELAPRDLIKRNVLSSSGDKNYRFAIELFRLWVKRNRRLSDVKDELDNVSPAAENFFNFGKNYFARKKWDDAIRIFIETLRIYPQHFRARLYLGEAYYELNKLDDAVNSLEEAYKMDNLESRFPLSRALVARANDFLAKGDETSAIKDLDRVLVISPSETIARDVRSNIFIKRGDAAFDKGDLRTAMVSYREAGATEKIAKINEVYRQNEIHRIFKKIEELDKAEKWAEALSIIEDALQEFPDEKGLLIQRNRALKNAELLEKYNQGIASLKRGDRNNSTKLFLDVMTVNPSFKDSAQKLLFSVKSIDVEELKSRIETLSGQNKLLSETNIKLDGSLKLEEAKNAQLTKELSVYKEKGESPNWLTRLFSKKDETLSPGMKGIGTYSTSGKTDFEKLGLAPPITQVLSTYVIGDDLFDESYSIDSSAGEFLGEYGVGISEQIGVGEPKKVTALEVWLFDKNDIQTATKVLMSQYAFNDSNFRQRLMGKGELTQIESNAQVLLETATLQLLVTVVELVYGTGNMPSNSFFERVILEFAIWPKNR